MKINCSTRHIRMRQNITWNQIGIAIKQGRLFCLLLILHSSVCSVRTNEVARHSTVQTKYIYIYVMQDAAKAMPTTAASHFMFTLCAKIIQIIIINKRALATIRYESVCSPRYLYKYIHIVCLLALPVTVSLSTSVHFYVSILVLIL